MLLLLFSKPINYFYGSTIIVPIIMKTSNKERSWVPHLSLNNNRTEQKPTHTHTYIEYWKQFFVAWKMFGVRTHLRAGIQHLKPDGSESNNSTHKTKQRILHTALTMAKETNVSVWRDREIISKSTSLKIKMMLNSLCVLSHICSLCLGSSVWFSASVYSRFLFHFVLSLSVFLLLLSWAFFYHHFILLSLISIHSTFAWLLPLHFISFFWFLIFPKEHMCVCVRAHSLFAYYMMVGSL